MAANNSARIEIEWLDAAGEILSTSTDADTTSIDDMTPLILWQDLEFSASAPAGAVKARVKTVHEYAGNVAEEAGSSWFDDLCFRPEIPDPPRPLKFTSITLQDGNISLTWDSLPDKGYSVFRSTDLSNWENEVSDNVESQGETTTYIFPNPDPNAPDLFFRTYENPPAN